MHTKQIRLLEVICIAALGLGLFQCSSSSNSSSTSAQPVTELIGASGGSVATSAGSGVMIPAGALSSNVTITVQSQSAAPALSTSQGVTVGQTLLFGPEGTQFAVPVTVTLAFDVSSLPAGKTASDVVIFTSPAASPDYTALATTLAADGQHVEAQTTHFSYFVPVVAAASSTGDGGGATAAVDAGGGNGTGDAGSTTSVSDAASSGDGSLVDAARGEDASPSDAGGLTFADPEKTVTF